MPINEHIPLIPKLRFPEFRQDGEWRTIKLGKISTIVRGGSPRPISEYLTKDPSGLNWLKIGDVEEDSKYITETQEKVRIEALNKTREIHPGDLILSNSMSFGRPYLSKIQSCIHDGWIAVTNIDTTVDHEFLYYLIMSSSSQRYFMDQAAGGGIRNLNADIIKLLPAHLPSGQLKIEEQQRIADCLGSLDRLVTAQSAKLGALRNQKKGLLQQLFPASGKTMPERRLPGFSDQWTPDTLEKLCKAKISYGIVQAGPHVPNGMPYIKSTDLNTELNLDSLERTSDEIARKYRRSEVVPGDLVFSLRGNIGESQIVPPEITVANLTQGTARIRPVGPTQFYFQALQSEPIRSRIRAVSKGSTFKEISLEDLRKIQVLHPGKAEQQKIADCLSSIDALVSALSQEIEFLLHHKKGLMQQLFPNPEEASK